MFNASCLNKFKGTDIVVSSDPQFRLKRENFTIIDLGGLKSIHKSDIFNFLNMSFYNAETVPLK